MYAQGEGGANLHSSIPVKQALEIIIERIQYAIDNNLPAPSIKQLSAYIDRSNRATRDTLYILTSQGIVIREIHPQNGNVYRYRLASGGVTDWLIHSRGRHFNNKTNIGTRKPIERLYTVYTDERFYGPVKRKPARCRICGTVNTECEHRQQLMAGR